MNASHHPLLAVLLGLSLFACGEEEVAASGQRGAPAARKKPKSGGAKPSRRSDQPSAEGGDLFAEEEDPKAKRPPPALDAQTFSARRDPFQGFVASEPVQPEPDPIQAERQVQLRQYSFEDLKLIVIANSRRSSVRPRVLFVAGDGISGTVRQGEYFSSAEVLLAAVNRDYVEIEVVDEELAASLGMKRGERRALYLRNE